MKNNVFIRNQTTELEICREIVGDRLMGTYSLPPIELLEQYAIIAVIP